MADEWSITETDAGGKEDFTFVDTEEDIGNDEVFESVSWIKVVS